MKTRKLLYSIVFVFSFVLLVIFFIPRGRIVKGFKLGELDLSGLTYNEAEKILRKYEDKELYLNFPNRSISSTYDDLGLSFNHSILKNYLNKCLFASICTYKELPTKERLNKIIELDQDKFNSYVGDLNSDLIGITDTPIIDLISFEFSGVDENAVVEVDKENLLNQLTLSNIYKDSHITLKLDKIYAGDPEVQGAKTDELINKVSLQPFVVKFGRTEVKLSQDDILSFLVEIEKDNQKYVFISEIGVDKFMDKVLKNINVAAKIDRAAAIDAVRRAILFRVPEEKIGRAIVLPLEGGPSTDGSLFLKYLELNKSQQRLYMFENGKLAKTYIISTGVTWETPSGNFKVLRKTPMTISYFGEWWMPWYLPIGTVNGPYYFGFHEVPYHKDVSGNIYSRDPETIGSPATGGCIQLLKGEAAELFDWADIGTPVLIHD